MFVRKLLLATGLALALAPLSHAQPPKDKAVEIKTDAEKTVLATSIDFGSDLGLEFASLKGMGARIEQARSAGDPVGLAAAAVELSVAEKVAGKMTAVKAADLLKEAAATAIRRNHSTELKAVAMMVSDETTKKELAERGVKAEEIEAMAKKGERKRGLNGSLLVINNCDRPVSVYINGRYVGNVSGHNERSFEVSDGPDDNTELLARTGKFKYGPRILAGEITGTWRWTLNPINQ